MGLVVAAALAAAAHTLAPDHWLPLAALARREGWTSRRTLGLSLLAGVGHVVASLTAAGVASRLPVVQGALEREAGRTVGTMLLAAALLSLVHRPARGHAPSGRSQAQAAPLTGMVLFGAAASPNWAGVGVLLAAARLGPIWAGAACLTVLVVTLGAYAVLTWVGRSLVGAARLGRASRHADALTAALLAAAGATALAGWLG